MHLNSRFKQLVPILQINDITAMIEQQAPGSELCCGETNFRLSAPTDLRFIPLTSDVRFFVEGGGTCTASLTVPAPVSYRLTGVCCVVDQRQHPRSDRLPRCRHGEASRPS